MPDPKDDDLSAGNDPPSKSARKRYMLSLQALGEALLGNTDKQLEQIPVADDNCSQRCASAGKFAVTALANANCSTSVNSCAILTRRRSNRHCNSCTTRGNKAPRLSSNWKHYATLYWRLARRDGAGHEAISRG
ncbi:MAG: hypothetical protein R3E50_08425 [Halioglobus sp.]